MTISLEEVVQIHEALNEQFWGASGLRDQRALEASLARPFASFAGEDLYPTPLHKAAALSESIIKNHPFIEGNMRTAYVLLRLQLLAAGLELTATEADRHAFILNIATSQLDYSALLQWLQTHTQPL